MNPEGKVTNRGNNNFLLVSQYTNLVRSLVRIVGTRISGRRRMRVLPSRKEAPRKSEDKLSWPKNSLDKLVMQLGRNSFIVFFVVATLMVDCCF